MTDRRHLHRGPIVRGLTLATSAVLLATLNAPGAAAADAPSPGAAGIGDRLYPGLGNGGYDVLHYDLDLRYATSRPAQKVDGSEVVTAKATQALSRFNLDFAGGGITAVLVNGRAAAYRHQGQELIITPARSLPKGSVFTTTVKHFTATPTVPGELTPSDAIVYSQDGQATAGQPDGEHYVFPSNDHPRDKATFTFRFDVPAGLTAVANGTLTHKRSSGGRTYWTYAMKQPMATELMQLAVGRYTVVNRPSVDGIAVRDVIPTRLFSRYQSKLGIERSHLSWMQDRVGRYPFPVYGSMVTTAELGFALETQTLSIFDAPTFDNVKGSWAPTMLHELAHQWFGDNVSPYEWSDIWLNEGHATWYEVTYGAQYGYLADDYSDVGTNNLTTFMKAIYAEADQLRADYGPVALLTGNSLEEQFSPNVYEGAALVLFALRQKAGAATFEKIERAWVRTYSGRSASTDDFITLASKVSGQNLRSFLGGWLYGETTPPMPGHPDWTTDPVQPSSSTSSTLATSLSNRRR